MIEVGVLQPPNRLFDDLLRSFAVCVAHRYENAAAAWAVDALEVFQERFLRSSLADEKQRPDDDLAARLGHYTRSRRATSQVRDRTVGARHVLRI